MTGPWHPTGHGRVNAAKPSALGVCDRCGFTYNLKDLRWQYQWQGLELQNLRLLVCTATCYDQPQIQLKTIILPPDPLPVLNPRPEAYSFEVPSYISTADGTHLITTSGDNLIMEIKVTPTPDPNNPYLVPPDF